MSKYLNISNGERDTKFPIYHTKLWDYFKKQQASIWTAEEIDLSKDTFEGIPEKSVHILKHLLAFFGVSDTIVQDNLADEIVSEFSSVEEIKTLMQQGANYNKKMLALKPHLKALRTLDKHKLLESEDTLNFLIDLNNGNPEAIRKLLKDKSIDIMDLDNSENDESSKSYSPVDYHVSDNEMVLDDVLDSIEGSPAYTRTLNVITSEWDKTSTEALAKNPSQIVLLNKQIEHGIYDKVIKELDRVRALGQYSNLSDFDAYVAVGRSMEQRGLLPEVNAAPAPVKPAADTSKEVERLNKRKAAGLTKPTVTKPSKETNTINPLALSDEEFERMSKQRKY